jgi:hypothetical protein
MAGIRDADMAGRKRKNVEEGPPAKRARIHPQAPRPNLGSMRQGLEKAREQDKEYREGRVA